MLFFLLFLTFKVVLAAAGWERVQCKWRSKVKLCGVVTINNAHALLLPSDSCQATAVWTILLSLPSNLLPSILFAKLVVNNHLQLLYLCEQTPISWPSNNETWVANHQKKTKAEEQKLARCAKRNERDRARRARKSAEVAVLQASREQQDPALPPVRRELLKPALVVEKTTREIAQQINLKAEQNGEPKLRS